MSWKEKVSGGNSPSPQEFAKHFLEHSRIEWPDAPSEENVLEWIDPRLAPELTYDEALLTRSDTSYGAILAEKLPAFLRTQLEDAENYEQDTRKHIDPRHLHDFEFVSDKLQEQMAAGAQVGFYSGVLEDISDIHAALLRLKEGEPLHQDREIFRNASDNIRAIVEDIEETLEGRPSEEHLEEMLKAGAIEGAGTEDISEVLAYQNRLQATLEIYRTSLETMADDIDKLARVMGIEPDGQLRQI